MNRTSEALAAELILVAEHKGVRIDQEYALEYIAARQRVETHPEDRAARQTVKHLEMLLSDFGRFTLPYEDWEKHCADVPLPT